MSTQTTYEIHLADVPNVPKHVTTDHVEYFESGIWVQAEAGRTFFPWGRVTMIRETVSGTPAGTEGTPAAETTDEPEDGEEPAQVVADEPIEEPSQ